MPTPPIKTINELEPELINGKGSPVGGMEPVTTAILTKTCMAIIAAIPDAR